MSVLSPERAEGKIQQLWTEKNDALRVNLRQVNLQMITPLLRSVPTDSGAREALEIFRDYD